MAAKKHSASMPGEPVERHHYGWYLYDDIDPICNMHPFGTGLAPEALADRREAGSK